MSLCATINLLLSYRDEVTHYVEKVKNDSFDIVHDTFDDVADWVHRDKIT